MTGEERRIIGVTSAAHGLNHGFVLVFSAVLPLLQRDFSTDYFHLGLIANVCFFACGIGALPSGMLADRIGPKRLITLYLFGAAFSSFLVAASGSLLALGVFIGLLGLFCSTYHPASNALISWGIKRRGKGFGIHGVSGTLGVALTPVAAGILASLLGWKATYAVFGIAGVAAGVASLSLPAAPQKEPTDTTKEPASLKNTQGALPFLMVFYASTAMAGLCYWGVLTFLPTYMAQRVHIDFLPMGSVALGGMMSTIALLSGTIGQYVGGTLSDRYPSERVYFAAYLLGAPFLFFVGLSTGLFLVLSALAYAFFYFSTETTGVHLLARHISLRFRGTGYGIHFLLNFGVGSFAATLAGYIADRFGLEWVFHTMGLSFVGAGVLAFVLIVLSPTKPSVHA